MNDAETVQKLADAMLRSFEMRRRSTGENYWCFRDNSRPEIGADGWDRHWTWRFTHAIHDPDENGVPNWSPDDYRYAFANEMLTVITESDEEDPYEEFFHVDHDYDLHRWLISHGNRVSYVEEVLDEMRVTGRFPESHEVLLGEAQVAEKQEIFDVVYGFLLHLEPEEVLDESAA